MSPLLEVNTLSRNISGENASSPLRTHIGSETAMAKLSGGIVSTIPAPHTAQGSCQVPGKTLGIGCRPLK